jgi:putative transposase
VPWPIWATSCRIKRWEISYAGTTSPRRRSERGPLRGQSFIRSHLDVLAGTDFFTMEVLTWRGLVTYYVLFFMEIGSRSVSWGGIMRHPDSAWMQQVARNATMEQTGYLNGCRYLLHDRDKKFGGEFVTTLAAGGVEYVLLPARRLHLNAHAERWVRSISGRLV